jgi:hypothetical protein
MPRKYPDEFRDRAMRLVDEAREGTHLSEYQATAEPDPVPWTRLV